MFNLLNYGKLHQIILTTVLKTTRLLLPSPLYFQSSENVAMLIISERLFLQQDMMTLDQHQPFLYILLM